MAVLLGQAGPGVDSANSNGNTVEFSQRLAASASGTVTRIAIKLGTNTSITSVHGAIYADNAGNLSGATRLSDDAVFSGNPPSGFLILTLATPVVVTSGTFYWISWVGVGNLINYTDFATTGGTERDTSPVSTMATTHPTTTASNANIANVWGDDFGAGGTDYPMANVRSARMRARR